MTRQISTPEPGFFEVRLRKRPAVWVSAIIYRPCPIEWEPETLQAIDRWSHLEAEINSEPVDPERVLRSGHRVSMARYLYLRDDREWARQHAPQSPEANPHQAVDVGELDPIF